jgi:hypothetical protein
MPQLPQPRPHPRAARGWRPSAPRRPARLRPVLERLEDRTLPATFLVTVTDDSGAGSLRDAITQSNATPGANVIDFNIGTGVQTISLLSTLPTVTVPVTIDGTSEPDFAGTPEIVLDGTSAGPGVNGLTVTAGSSAVMGLVIDNFSGNGVALQTGGHDVIAGNYIGVDSSGAAAAGNGGDGVAVSGSSNNTVGGTAAGAGNVISANSGDGVEVFGGANGNAVQGNLIGTDVTGTAALGNGNDGVALSNAAGGTLIGGTAAGAGNVISANAGDGVEIVGPGLSSNIVQGNLIGTDVTGTAALGNGADGVAVHGPIQVFDTTVGGTAAGARNVISGNAADGVDIFGMGASGNSVLGNFIGTDVTGTAALGNGADGVAVHDGASDTFIGNTAAGDGNVISANTANGVDIFGSGATVNRVEGNFIGTDVSGSTALGNGGNGVLITNSSNNTIGGTAPGAGNVIAFSGNDGVKVDTGTGDAVRQNSIHDSTNLGIELVNNGNNNQPAPTLASAVVTASSITVQGTLSAAASTSYALDFFASPTANASGAGEGQQLLGSATVTTNSGGTASFTVTFSAAVPAGESISATATSPAGNTSAFAQDVTAAAPAGLVITPTFDSSITNDPNAAAIETTINAAIQVYEATYSSPVTVQIYFREGGGLGQSIFGFYDIGYQTFRQALAANQALSGQADQATALAHLPNQANNPVTNIPDLTVQSANGRALGLNTPGFLNSNGQGGGTFDGIVSLNTSITFPPQPNNGGTYSLQMVAEHEIDEVLGKGSALPNPSNFGNGPTPSAEDLYRYDAGGNRTFTASSGAHAFFSLDGTTRLNQYDNQFDGGDFADWQSNPRPSGVPPQVQDAFATPGVTPSLGVELTALDAIGYTRFSSGPALANPARGDLAGLTFPSRSVRMAAELPRALPGLALPVGVAHGAAAEGGPALPLPAEPLLALARGPAVSSALAGPPSVAPAASAGAGATGALDRFLADDDLSAALAGAHSAAPADEGWNLLVDALAARQAPAWK